MNYNRDLLYVKPTNNYYATTLQTNVDSLHTMLYSMETLQHLVTCTEIVDVNKLKIIKKKHLVEQLLRQPQLKQFQFVNNLN